ncbi:methyl-accepting chemotaxis protein, partial [Luteimonas sp. RD2P54]|nr:methyl-accepting chemotaxis protein [Luteimonas endophytica]
VTDIMGEISAASQEQASGIEQVNQTIVSMDETTQQNAALVEEASASAHSMEEQAAQLAQAIASFRLDGGGSGAAVAPQRRAQAARPAAPTGPRPAASRPAPVAKRAPGKAAPALAVAAEDDWAEF